MLPNELYISKYSKRINFNDRIRLKYISSRFNHLICIFKCEQRISLKESTKIKDISFYILDLEIQFDIRVNQLKRIKELIHLMKLTNLRKLNLFGCNHITDQGLKQLKELNNLKEVILIDCM